MSNSEISFYVDTLIVEAVLCDESVFQGGGLRKEASVVGDLLSKVKDYVGQHMVESDKVGSVVNMLAPAAISAALGAMGFGWWRILIGLAMSVFHIDVMGIFRSVWGSIKGLISGGKQTSSEQIDTLVQSAVKENTKPVDNEQEAQKAQENAQSFPGLSAGAKLRQAKMLKVAMVEYDRQTFALTKEAVSLNPLAWFSKGQSSTSSLLGTILGWIFKVVLASAGFLVAGDVINKFLGRPNALDKTYQAGKSSSEPIATAPTTRQTKFPVNPSYSEGAHGRPWVESVPNNKSSIANMVLSWAKEVYSGLNGQESLITSSPAFQAVVDQITWYNHASAGDNLVFLPKMYGSKKGVVDYFIDDVAQKAK